MSKFHYIELTADRSLQTSAAEQQRIGIDTEFMREKTYFAQLCLIQVATADGIYCADPLTMNANGDATTDEFWQTLMTPEWILHSGRQDVEVVFQTANRMPESVFDTQIAAALLGYQPQVGYANLVADLFGVELAKSHTRADWSQRPLPPAAIEYAAEDVEYLLPAYDLLSNRLAKLGRLQWAIEDSQDLLNAALYSIEPDQAIGRVKGAKNLSGKVRAAAVGLAAWRETEALRRNRPRQWILRDSVLLDTAAALPKTRAALQEVPALSAKTIERAGDQLLEILAETAHQNTDYLPPEKPSEEQKAVLKRMQKLVSLHAEKLDIASEVIAPKKELSAAMLGERELRIFRGWRGQFVGAELLQLLEDA